MTGARIAAIEKATHRSWEDWLVYLASIDADSLDHHDIATHLLTELDGIVDNIGWWAQATAVAYEQHVGRRVPGQQPDGTFRTSVSRSTPLDMAALMEAWTTFAADNVHVRELTTTAPRISGTDRRITWRTKGHERSTITVISEPQKSGLASLVVQHGGLPSPETSDRTRQTWREIVEDFLSGHPARA